MGVASGCGYQEVGVASGSGWNLYRGSEEGERKTIISKTKNVI